MPALRTNLPLRARRGTTLIEVLIVMAIVALVVSISVVGFGAVGSARLRQATTQVGGSVRVAYTHATAVSKIVRLDFDFDDDKVYLQESEGRHLLRSDEVSGADDGSQAESLANQAAGAARLRAPQGNFSTVGAMGIPEEGIQLPTGIELSEVDSTHQDAPIREGHAYLYFFPGGQTEAATVRVHIANTDSETGGFMTVQVLPLTGRSKIHRGKFELVKPEGDEIASELSDPGL